MPICIIICRWCNYIVRKADRLLVSHRSTFIPNHSCMTAPRWIHGALRHTDWQTSVAATQTLWEPWKPEAVPIPLSPLQPQCWLPQQRRQNPSFLERFPGRTSADNNLKQDLDFGGAFYKIVLFSQNSLSLRIRAMDEWIALSLHSWQSPYFRLVAEELVPSS